MKTFKFPPQHDVSTVKFYKNKILLETPSENYYINIFTKHAPIIILLFHVLFYA